MKIREILQIEIWSKRTSRKILVGIGIVVSLLTLGLFAWYEVECHWLTKGERIAASVALQRIDLLQGSDSLSDEEFKVRNDQVNSAVDAAEIAARTTKDELIAADLIMCSMKIESARMKMLKQRWIQQGKLHQSENDRESDSRIELFTDKVTQLSCLKLHQELK